MTHRPAAAAMAAAALLTCAVAPAAQTDLDAFMEQVIARRDENWKKLQQYVLDERETFELTGADGRRQYGYRRSYTWFIRQGFFIRSPLEMDGVKVSERDRTAFEQQWLERERRREKYGEKITGLSIPGGIMYGPERTEEAAGATSAAGAAPTAAADAVLKQTMEPRFVSAAYFLRFKFDPGHYALAGRERIGDRTVLRIEYYPSRLFSGSAEKADRDQKKDDERVLEKLNKVALITLWIEPTEHQIVQYTFDNIDMDFLPARSLVRIDGLKASMRMTQPAPSLWLPGTIDIRFQVTMATGPMAARYAVEYHDYRQADVTIKIK